MKINKDFIELGLIEDIKFLRIGSNIYIIIVICGSLWSLLVIMLQII